MDDPKNCDRCNASLERGWSERWRGETHETMVRIEAVCFDCDRKERHATYAASGVLTTRMLTDAAIYGVRREHDKDSYNYILDKVERESEEIRRRVKDFERGVWFRGLQKQVRATSHRGFRADGEDVCVLVWSCAGRTVMTIEPPDESHSVSLITADDETEPVMGIQGICATKEQASALITAAISAYNNGVAYRRDDKVGMF